MGREQVAHADVAGLQPVTPGHPGGRQDRVGTGQQRAVVDRDVLGARGARHGHGPAPAGVGGVETLEQVGDDPVAAHLDTEMLAHLLGTNDVLQCGTRQANGFRARLIWLSAADTDWAHD